MSTPITIYSADTCPWCDKAKHWMKEQGIEYVELNIDTDPAHHETVFQLTNQKRVPVFVKGDAFVVGFDPVKVKSLAQAA